MAGGFPLGQQVVPDRLIGVEQLVRIDHGVIAGEVSEYTSLSLWERGRG